MKNQTSKFSLYAIFLITIALLSSSCSSKNIDPDSISFSGHSVNSNNSISIELDKNANIGINTPFKEFDVKVSSSDPSLTYTVEKNTLKLLATSVGDFEIVCTVSAKGYKPENITVPVNVYPHEMPLSVVDTATKGETSQVTMLEGGEASLLLVAPPETEFYADILESGIFSASVEENIVHIKATSEGSALLRVTAKCDGYGDKHVEIEVNVVLKEASLSLPSDYLPLPIDASSYATVIMQANAQLSFSYDTDAMKVAYSNGRIMVTPLKPGNYNLEIICNAEGFAPSKKILEVDISDSDETDKIVRLTNELRAAAGLSPLTRVSKLDEPAAVRAAEAARLWSHTRPDGSMWGTILEDFDINYSYSGENLYASTVYSAESAVKGWYNSPSHKNNLLNENYEQIGVAIFYNYSEDKYYYCQLFMK